MRWGIVIAMEMEVLVMASRDTLHLLLDELEFLNYGGYDQKKHSFRAFEDSPSCPNFGNAEKTIPCSECELMQFVPLEDRDEAAPCQFIRLNRYGDTPEMMYNWGSPGEMKRCLKSWLLRQIAKQDQRNGEVPPRESGV
jgi:hypothetical protein